MRYRLSACGFFVAFLLSPSPGTGAEEPPADLVLRNGKIVTMDDRQPVVAALAARGGRIVAVGRNEDVAKLVGDKTKVLDLAGRFAMPGFIEGHGHYVGLGQSRMVLDLRKARTWDDIVHQVEEAAKKTPAGEWILGRGWHQEKWAARPEPNVEGYPTHAALSAVTPRNPVVLTHASGHMSFANGLAMRLAGVDARTANPPGGEVLKDAQGNPTGVFRETAQGLIGRVRDEHGRTRSAADRARDLHTALRLAEEECLAKGVTSFQDAGSPFETIDVLKGLAEQGKLRLRLWVMVRTGNDDLARRLAAYRMIGVGDQHLTVRAIKRSIDGALGAHGAWLLETYEDLKTSAGLNTSSVASIRETARLALQHDYQLCVHAIGDRANRETLNLFEEALRESPGKGERRWRVEHAQHLHPADIPRFAKLGVIASMQGIHCTSDAVYVLQRLGTRRAAEGAYVWQSLLKTGAVVSNGTDAPVEDVDPIACYYASVTRRLPSGTTFFPEQKMTREQALRSYTVSAAYAAFEEDIKGSLAPGKLADVVVLSQDLLTVPDDKLLDTRVLYTIVGGKVLYQRE
jgi:predicted amidohydrolase YtcJ